MARPALTTRRLLGLDRSGGPPPETGKGAPLRPLTLPNLVSFVRLALVPVFLVLALGSDDGRDVAAALLFFAIAWGDQLDGFVARVTGQYSRLGALLDPLVDRGLVLAGAVVCFHFDLLPRWALIVLAARELFMLALTRYGMRRGMDLSINMVGRWAVWPIMLAIFLALLVETWVDDAFLVLGLVLTLWATILYIREGLRFSRSPGSATTGRGEGPSTST